MQKLFPFTIVLILVSCSLINAQELNILKIEAHGGDTLATVKLSEVLVFTKKEFASNEERMAFERLKRNTIKVYPYVKVAVEIYNEMKEDMDGITKKRKQKQYVKNMEEDLRTKFEEQIRDLTKSQGAVLIKLVNRETGNNCYQIIKDLKNPVTAFVWNAVGKRYGHDLKAEYKPEENPDLEFIVRMLNEGQN